MATELKKLTVDASNGSYTFEVVDAEARETANAAKTAADGISIPTALPNPNKLTFTGGATGEYDGSAAVTINIPTGGEGGGSGPIQRIESLDESNLANLRDLDTGTYVLYGYFYPFAGAADTLTCDNTLVSVAHLSAGSHVLVFNPLNCKVNFVEILVDESAEGGYTYSVQLIDMRDLNALIAMVGDLDGLSTTDKTTLVAAINEVAASAGGVVSTEPADDDIPKVFFGGALQQTKDEAVVSFRYISKTEDISGYAEIKAQGNSSMNFPKKNQTVKLFKDADCAEKLKVDFKGWGKQNKHVYKANWIDLTHARNVVSARLWADVVKSRANYAELPELLRTSPNQGAIDGFPVKVYADGVYQGRYTLNIPKDKWTFNMDDELDNHCVLCGENYVSGCFRASASINGSDWSDEIHDSVPASILTRWNEVIDFVMNSTDEEFKANLNQYFYVDSLIDYHLFGLASCGLDAYGKNQLYATYDGQKWIASMYDMDSTWGLYFDGSKIVATDYARTQYEDFRVSGREGNLLYIRLEQLFYEELQTRWAELKNGALSIENIINRFERFTDIAPAELVKEDFASTTGGGKFTGIPSQSTNNIQQIRSFALARQAWTDKYVTGLGVSEPEEPDTPDTGIPCTGISLDKTELTFNGEGTQTITATVNPADTTDTAVWVSSNLSVASISVEGNICTVQSVGNGDTTITVTCGKHSANCTVSVSRFAYQSVVLSQYYDIGENGAVEATGSESNYGLEEFFEVSPYSDYTINTPAGWMWVVTYDADKNFLKKLTGGVDLSAFSFHTGKSVKYVRWGCYGSVTNATSTIEKTKELPVDVVSNSTTMENGYTFPSTSGDFTESGTNNWALPNYYPVTEGKTYKITSANAWLSVKGYDESTNYVSNLNTANGTDATVTFTVPSGIKYIRWSCAGGNDASVSTIEETA